MDTIITAVITAFGTTAVICLLIFLNPEKITTWIGMIWKAVSWMGDFARKRQIKAELEGRIGEFSRAIKTQAPYLDVTKPTIEWIEGETEKKAFLKGGEVIVRLRREDPKHHNFVHGVMMFVAASFLPRTKRYLSASQRQALDLFCNSTDSRSTGTRCIHVFYGRVPIL